MVSDTTATATAPQDTPSAAGDVDAGAYEVLRRRLSAQAGELVRRAEALNVRRTEEFGSTGLRLLATEGRLVQIAFLQGPKAEVDFTALMVKRLTFTGSTLRARPPEQKAALADALRAQVWPVLEAGRLLPVIHEVFPLERAADAHRLMESSTHIGKIMLEVDPALA